MITKTPLLFLMILLMGAMPLAGRQPGPTRNKYPTRAELAQFALRFEQLFDRCVDERSTGRRSERCADILYTLGWIYYDQAVDESQEGYLGIPPTQPQPDFSKFLQIYQLLMEEYPDVLPRVSLRMATFYIASGKPDSAKIILEQSLEQFPHSPFISRIHFRLADIAFTEGRFSQSYDHLQEIRKNQIDSASWERAHYRRGECMYRLGNFDTAIRYFHTFVIECDARRYRRTLGLRCEAVKFIASAFSNMPDGARRWNDFSQENRDRPHISEIEARLRF